MGECLAAFEAITIPSPAAGFEHAWYRFSFDVDESRLNAGWDRRKIMTAINAEGIACLEACPEIYREKAFDNLDMPTPNCPNAIALGDRVLLLQVHPMLDEQAVDSICSAVSKVMRVASA